MRWGGAAEHVDGWGAARLVCAALVPAAAAAASAAVPTLLAVLPATGLRAALRSSGLFIDSLDPGIDFIPQWAVEPGSSELVIFEAAAFPTCGGE